MPLSVKPSSSSSPSSRLVSEEEEEKLVSDSQKPWSLNPWNLSDQSLSKTPSVMGASWPPLSRKVSSPHSDQDQNSELGFERNGGVTSDTPPSPGKKSMLPSSSSEAAETNSFIQDNAQSTKNHGSSSGTHNHGQQQFSHSRPSFQNQRNSTRPQRYNNNNNRNFNRGYDSHRNMNARGSFPFGHHGPTLPPHPYGHPNFNSVPPLDGPFPHFPPFSFPQYPNPGPFRPPIQHPYVPPYSFSPHPIQYPPYAAQYNGHYDPYFSGGAPPRPTPQHINLQPAPQPSNLRDKDAGLCKSIRLQIEYYFSDENLVTDSFLRNQMDENGWVPVELIANFNKVKLLTSDLDLVMKALRPSQLVQVEGKSIRKHGDWWKWLPTEEGETLERDLIKKMESIHVVSSN